MARFRTAALSPLLVLASTAAAATPASALYVSSAGGALRVVAAPGERNDLALSSTVAAFVVTSRGSTPAEGPGCTRSSGVVRCPRAGVAAITVQLGDRDDALAMALPASTNKVPVSISGGAGTDSVNYAGGGGPVSVTLDGQPNDGPAGRGDNVGTDVERVSGTRADDTLTGSALADRLTGLHGQDTVSGGGGNDLIDSRELIPCKRAPGHQCLSSEPDKVSCGPGTDIVDGDFTDVIAPDCELVALASRLFLTPANDVFTGWRRALTISGGRGDDRLTGRGRDDLNGNSGNDVLRAGPRGMTSLVGGYGNDLLVSAGSSDYLAGGYGSDRLIGGGGNDFESGGAGRDVLSGGAGNDRIVSRERGSQRDRVACGPGRDTVIADRRDVVDPRSCERVVRR